MVYRQCVITSHSRICVFTWVSCLDQSRAKQGWCKPAESIDQGVNAEFTHKRLNLVLKRDFRPVEKGRTSFISKSCLRFSIYQVSIYQEYRGTQLDVMIFWWCLPDRALDTIDPVSVIPASRVPRPETQDAKKAPLCSEEQIWPLTLQSYLKPLDCFLVCVTKTHIFSVSQTPGPCCICKKQRIIIPAVLFEEARWPVMAVKRYRQV